MPGKRKRRRAKTKKLPIAVRRRRIVFFLGAGASVAVGARAVIQGRGYLDCPTQKNFWSTFLRFCKRSSNRKKIESFLFRYFLGYRKVPGKEPAADRRQKLNGIDVEEVFTFLSERISAPATSPQLRTVCNGVWDALVAEVGFVFRRFNSSRKTTRAYNKFMDRHVRNWDTVVSFNYDTVFEQSIADDYTYFYEGIQERGNWEHRVIKPHGSVNWTKIKGRIEVRSAPEQCIVVAPTHLKFVSQNQADNADNLDGIGYLNQSDEMSKIWASMEAQMKEANALVFIGYSFPVADLYFSSVLRSVLAIRAAQPKIVIVNPDAVAIRQRLEARFSLEKIVTYYDFEQFSLADRGNITRN